MIYKTLYKIKNRDENSAVVELCDKNHPVFKAHFPTKPVLPGFIHFEIVADIFGLEITTIKKAKFMKMVLPNQLLTYKKDNNKFKVICEDDEVASFSL